MESLLRTNPPFEPARGGRASIDFVGEDLLQNTIARLPAFSSPFAACVNHSWNVVYGCVLYCPKLSSAFSLNSSLEVTVEEIVNKVLSEPIRPHFTIASIGPSFNLHEAHELITAKLGFRITVITTIPFGIIGRDAYSDEFKEWEIIEDDGDEPDAPVSLSESANRAIMLIVGYVLGLRRKCPLIKSHMPSTWLQLPAWQLGAGHKDDQNYYISYRDKW